MTGSTPDRAEARLEAAGAHRGAAAVHPACADLVAELLASGHTARLRVSGVSMQPTLLHGDRVILAGLGRDEARPGDIVAFRRGDQLVLHRVLRVERRPGGEPRYLTAGDGLLHHDGRQPASSLVGKVVRVHRDGGSWSPGALPRRLQAGARVLLARHPRARSALRAARAAVRRTGAWRPASGPRAGAGA